MITLDSLPHEIILGIGGALLPKRSYGSGICCLIRSSSRYAEILIPFLYKTAFRLTREPDPTDPQGGGLLTISTPPHRIWHCVLYWQSRFLFGYLSTLSLEWINEVKFGVEGLPATFESIFDKCVRSGNLALVQMLPEKGVSPNIGTPIFIAVACGHFEICTLLMDAGADITGRIVLDGVQGDTPLCQAIARAPGGQRDEITLLLIERIVSKGESIDSPGYCNRTPLHYAVEYSSLEIVHILLACGANAFSIPDPGLHDISTEIAFCTAARRQREDICMLLIDHMEKTDIEQFLKQEDFPLHIAIDFRLWAIVQRLVKLGFDPTIRNPTTGKNALHRSITRSPPEEVIDILLTHGPEVWAKPGDAIIQGLFRHHVRLLDASTLLILKKLHELGKITINPNEITERGNALHVVCQSIYSQRGSPPSLMQITKLLLELGVSPDFQNKSWDCTPLHELCNRLEALPSLAIVELLIDHLTNSSMTSQDHKGNTCLHLAASKGHVEVVRMLLKRMDQKDILTRNKKGNCALHEIRSGDGCTPILRLLIQHNPEIVHCRNLVGETPLHLITLYSNSAEAIKILYEAGADFSALSELLEPPIHNNSAFRSPEITRFFIEVNADLHLSCQTCVSDLARFREAEQREYERKVRTEETLT